MNDPTRPFIIINQTANRARRAWPRISKLLAQSGVRFDACEPERADETQAQTRAALREGYRTIAVVGGDGTLSQAAAGFFESCCDLAGESVPGPIGARAALAILPAGTGDDFARGLTGRREPVERWVERLVIHCRSSRDSDDLRPCDLLYGTTDGGKRKFIGLNAATLGIGAEVAARVAAQHLARRLPGEARFTLAALGALLAWRERRVSVRIDAGDPLECATNLIAIVNGAYAGGGMRFSPAAQTNDGRLDVVTACGISRAGIIRELTRIHRGGHLANPRVRVTHGARVRVEALSAADTLGVEVDGDVRGSTPVDIRVMPRALRVIL